MPFIFRTTVAALAFASLAGPAVAQQHDPLPPPSVARYRIEPADVLVVKYRYTPEYDSVPTVQPDGYISLPMVGQVKVGGLTVEEATTAIEREGGLKLREPEVIVELKEFQRPRFFVTGEVGKPGEFPLHGQMGILEAIAMAGGFKSSAKHSQVALFRKIDDRHMMRTVLDAKKIAKSVDSGNVELAPGDVLVVPQNRISKLDTVVPLIGAVGGLAWFISVLK